MPTVIKEESFIFGGLFNATLIGLVVCAVCVVIHALGTSVIVHFLRKKGYEMLHGRSVIYAVLALVLTSIWLLLLHIGQVVIWAEVYLHLLDIHEIQDIETALYFSGVTYTTLGYGDIVLHDHWRIMSAIEAMNGILLFGWSTALLFAVVREIIRQVDPVAFEYEEKVQIALENHKKQLMEKITEDVRETIREDEGGGDGGKSSSSN